MSLFINDNEVDHYDEDGDEYSNYHDTGILNKLDFLRIISYVKFRDNQLNQIALASPLQMQYEIEVCRGLQITKFKSIPDKPRFVNNKITNSTNDHLLIIKFTRKFNNFAESLNCKFVNTEEYEWIQSIHDYKSDGLLCRRGLYVQRKESGTKQTKDKRKLSHIMKGNMFLFGQGAWEIKDMYNCIIDFKVKYSSEDRGRMYSYLLHMSMNDSTSTYRGILFDQDNFLCVECQCCVILRVVEGLCTDSGSFQYIKEFSSHRNHWLRLVDWNIM